MIKLYGISQSRASRCLWMLEELGVPYEQIPIGFGDLRKPDYLKINPNGRLPALEDDGLVLFESLAINLHLARKYDKGLWPKSADDQSRAVQWTLWVVNELEPHVIAVFLNTVAFPEPQRDASKVKAAKEALVRPLPVLNAALAGRETLLGGPFSVADLNVACVAAMGARFGAFDAAAYPNVKTWLDRCNARPA